MVISILQQKQHLSPQIIISNYVDFDGYVESAFITKIPSFSNWIFKPKSTLNNRGSKNHFGFLRQVDFNKSSMTRMVFLTNLKVVLLTIPKMVLLIKKIY